MNASGYPSRTWICVLAAIGLTCVTGALPAQAQEPTKAQIIEALKPKAPLTRGLTVSPRAAEEKSFIDGLRTDSATRSLTVRERERVSAIAQERPKIDLEINFEFNSDRLSSRGAASAKTLGEALTSPEMKGMTMLVAGHTDGKGSAEYNQDLSERRAATVKKFLMENYGLTAENLVTAGYGKERLKNPGAPYAGENRRVEVVNLSAQSTAQKTQ